MLLKYVMFSLLVGFAGLAKSQEVVTWADRVIESTCVKQCLNHKTNSTVVVEKEDEEVWGTLDTPTPQPHTNNYTESAKCKTSMRVTSCLGNCSHKFDLNDYFMAEFQKLEDILCSSNDTYQAVNRDKEFNDSLNNCKRLLNHINSVHPPTQQMCVIVSNKKKAGREICRVLDKCINFLEETCSQQVADFFKPIVILEIAIAELFYGSNLPPLECPNFFFPSD